MARSAIVKVVKKGQQGHGEVKYHCLAQARRAFARALSEAALEGHEFFMPNENEVRGPTILIQYIGPQPRHVEDNRKEWEK